MRDALSNLPAAISAKNAAERDRKIASLSSQFVQKPQNKYHFERAIDNSNEDFKSKLKFKHNEKMRVKERGITVVDEEGGKEKWSQQNQDVQR